MFRYIVSILLSAGLLTLAARTVSADRQPGIEQSAVAVALAASAASLMRGSLRAL